MQNNSNIGSAVSRNATVGEKRCTGLYLFREQMAEWGFESPRAHQILLIMTAIDWLVLAVAVVTILLLACQHCYKKGRYDELMLTKGIVIERYRKFTNYYETEKNTISKDGVTFLKPLPKVIGVVAKEVFDKVLDDLDKEEYEVSK